MKSIVDYHLECDLSVEVEAESTLEAMEKVADDKKICLFCVNSLSGDAPDGTEVLVCFECAGHKGKMMIVWEDETCENFKGQ